MLGCLQKIGFSAFIITVMAQGMISYADAPVLDPSNNPPVSTASDKVIETNFNKAIVFYFGDPAHGIAQNDALAAQYALKAATMGDTVAQAIVGDMYRMGKGVTQNDQQAAVWYQKSIPNHLEFPTAYNNLGILYAHRPWGFKKYPQS